MVRGQFSSWCISHETWGNHVLFYLGVTFLHETNPHKISIHHLLHINNFLLGVHELAIAGLFCVIWLQCRWRFLLMFPIFRTLAGWGKVWVRKKHHVLAGNNFSGIPLNKIIWWKGRDHYLCTGGWSLKSTQLALTLRSNTNIGSFWICAYMFVNLLCILRVMYHFIGFIGFL